MSYIVRSGNLAGTVTLKETGGETRAYATVVVNDREKAPDGSWKDAATTSYRLTVSGPAAARLKAFQERNGNARVLFSGSLRSRTYLDNEQQARRSNDVWVDEIGASLTFHDLAVETTGSTPDNPEQPPEPEVPEAINPWMPTE